MSIATLILGSSGLGKSASLRNLNPNDTFLIQCIKKPLPFKSTAWKIKNEVNPNGNIYQTDNTTKILQIIHKAPHEVIVIDDYQACLVNELMSRSSERTYEKFTDIGKNAWQLFNTAGALSSNKRIYILSHTQTDEYGQIKMKTVGKMVDQTIVPEGFFTIVLRADLVNNKYVFRTQTNGSDCCKSPMGLFEQEVISNDLKFVDDKIKDFYSLAKKS